MDLFCVLVGCLPNPEKIFVHHAARIIGCSPRTIRRFIQLGILPAERAGKRSWLVPRSAVDRIRRARSFSW